MQSECGGILAVITAFLPVFSCPFTNDFYIIDAKIYECEGVARIFSSPIWIIPL